MTEPPAPTDFDDAVEEVVANLRPGEVVTYGWVAVEAGFPGRHRGVGTFLARRYGGPNWWRVVDANGRLRAPSVSDQDKRLRAEGVEVVDGKVRGTVKRPS
jgi:methylated-DNA-protein-cysteine methyltransferase related protein